MPTPLDRHFDVLAAWIDGEAADRADVCAALETAEGRDYVIDIMALRRMVADTSPPKSPAVGPLPRRWPAWASVAAAAVICVVAGYGAGRLAGDDATREAAVVAPLDDAAGASAPVPTHVIRFETGVDWRETSGGN